MLVRAQRQIPPELRKAHTSFEFCYSWVFGTDLSDFVNMNNSLPKPQSSGEERKNVMSLRCITWSCSADTKWDTDSVGNTLNFTFSGYSCASGSEVDPLRIIL